MYLSKTSFKQQYLAPLFMGIVAISAAATVQAAETTYDHISFSSAVKSEVSNDQVHAMMSKESQAKDAKTLATQLNMAMNNALKVAKNYPTVTVSTGHNSSYPSYNKSGKINGWTGSASVDIKSTDLEAASQLISSLQDSLVLGDLSFGVSEKRQDQIEREMLVKVSKAFQNQAKTVSSAWGANDYRVVNVQLNTGSNYSQPMMLSQKYSMAKASADVPAQNFESGNSTITVTANGTIELVR